MNGKVFDVSSVDPSMAGAAGGHALITTGGDLVRFLDALLAGRLFRRPETLRQMLTFAPAPTLAARSATASGSNAAWHPAASSSSAISAGRAATTPTSAACHANR